MYTLTIASISQNYNDLDTLMNDCFEVFPEADFSLWNETATEAWQDVFESHENKTIIDSQVGRQGDRVVVFQLLDVDNLVYATIRQQLPIETYFLKNVGLVFHIDSRLRNDEVSFAGHSLSKGWGWNAEVSGFPMFAGYNGWHYTDGPLEYADVKRSILTQFEIIKQVYDANVQNR